jgi:hypothetical protein
MNGVLTRAAAEPRAHILHVKVMSPILHIKFISPIWVIRLT